MPTLHAVEDDFILNANEDIERGSTVILSQFFFVDQAGNFLVDQAGNFLIGYGYETVVAQILHAGADDFKLNAEQ